MGESLGRRADEGNKRSHLEPGNGDNGTCGWRTWIYVRACAIDSGEADSSAVSVACWLS